MYIKKNLHLRPCHAAAVVALFLLFAACAHDKRYSAVDELNDKAYHYHYVSLDSAYTYASAAYDESDENSVEQMEALNNIAFCELAAMDYADAEEHLKSILSTTDDALEQFVANVQMMRLCQRMSRNKEFYTYYWAADRYAQHLAKHAKKLTPRQQQRYTYACSEKTFVYAAYLYYIGQEDNFREEIGSILVDEIEKDTAQLLNYLYNIGSGGYFRGTPEEVSFKEFAALIYCYFFALRTDQIYWQANALQAVSEHLLDRDLAPLLIEGNALFLRAMNEDDAPDSLLAGNFAQRALNLFIDYDDTYQIAGALRSLADCYFQIGLYHEAIQSLDLSLNRDTLIDAAPALTSSIYERLSINFSAIDNKPYSDYYRNLYLDTQEDTRQDRELDVRAEQLSKVSTQLNIILLILLALVVILFGTLYTLVRRRNQNNNQETIKKLLLPLEKWKEQQTTRLQAAENYREGITEQQTMARLTLERSMRINVEQRAKVALVNSITPLINHILAEINTIKTRQEDNATKAKRFAYIAELNDQINKYNDVLTRWIQLRKGELSLKIESFAMQELFDIIAKSKATYAMNDIRLDIKPSTAVVKADKALTLFMLNTIADNARKAIDHDGDITIAADEAPDYVEISIADNGKGMTQEELQHIFTRQSVEQQHGFGLMNCKGIIEKYKKMSNLFSVCQLTAESTEGSGATFRFRLPRGVARLIVALIALAAPFTSHAADFSALKEGKAFADSAYFCNLQGRYEDALAFAEKTYTALNDYYKSVSSNADTLLFVGDTMAELRWLADSIEVDYSVILDVRNETAVAALALHEWNIYSYNNKIYTRLFRELSSDHQLPAYVKRMEEVSQAKNIAIAVLAVLLVCIMIAYYFLYHRPKVAYKAVVARVGEINAALFEDVDDGTKLDKIRSLWDKEEFTNEKDMNNVVEQIIATLETSKDTKLREAESIEEAMDELNKTTYENECLHVSNNVLDNCLSALKHETMYYPSKLQQLLESPDDKNIDYLAEVAEYYQALFTLLSMQAQAQVESPLRVDDKLKTFLHSLMMTLYDGPPPLITQQESDDTYDTFAFSFPQVNYSDEQINNLFQPLTANLKCLLVRQIVREMGETTNRRACGIKALRGAEGGLTLLLTLAKEIQFDEIIKA